MEGLHAYADDGAGDGDGASTLLGLGSYTSPQLSAAAPTEEPPALDVSAPASHATPAAPEEEEPAEQKEEEAVGVVEETTDIPAQDDRARMRAKIAAALPPALPASAVDEAIARKVAGHFEKKRKGMSIAAYLRRPRFRNPAMQHTMSEGLGINEHATNFPPSVFAPDAFHASEFYEELAAGQLRHMERAAALGHAPDTIPAPAPAPAPASVPAVAPPRDAPRPAGGRRSRWE